MDIENKGISHVWDFHELNKPEYADLPIVCKFPDDTEVALTPHYYVVDSIAFLYTLCNELNDVGPATVKNILNRIDCERQEDCWDGYKKDTLFANDNDYYNCEVQVTNDYYFDYDDVKSHMPVYSIKRVNIEQDRIVLILE